MTPRLRQWLAVCALGALTLLAYGNSFDSGFAFDNRILLLEDSRIHKATIDNLKLIFSHTYSWPTVEAGLYRPVTTLSYLFNYAILGNANHPAGYHWINLLLHAGNVLLVFALARRLVRDFWQSFLIAALWAVHPVLTESVTNIIGRADLLAGMTLLGGLLMYLRSTETAGWRRLAWLVGLGAVTAVGVFCKESAVAVLAVIALYELTWWNRGRLRGFLFACIAMAPAFLAMWWARSKVLAASPPAIFPFVDNPIVGAGFWMGRLTAVKVMAKYLGLLVWPGTLSSDYSYSQIPLADGRHLADWLAWIVVAALAIGVVSQYRRNKTVFFAAGFALIALLPASNLIVPVGTIMAERFLYLPAIGFAICLTLALYAAGRRLRMRPEVPLVLGLLAVGGLGARTWARNPDWRNDLAFWSAAVQTSPLSFKTHLGLAQELMHADYLNGDRMLSEDEKSMALLDPLPDQLKSPATYVWASSHYVAVGDSLRPQAPAESMAKYQRAKSILVRCMSILQAQHKAERERQPGLWGARTSIDTNTDLSARLMLSEVDERLGKADESLHEARDAWEAGPTNAAVYDRIHGALLAVGRKDEAMAALMEGVILTSDPALRRKLVADYSDNPEAKACAISYARAIPQIDFTCGFVRKQVCLVSGEVVRAVSKTGDRDVAMRMKNELTAKYGCP